MTLMEQYKKVKKKKKKVKMMPFGVVLTHLVKNNLIKISQKMMKTVINLVNLIKIKKMITKMRTQVSANLKIKMKLKKK